MEITREHAEKVLEIVDCGLIGGAGASPVNGGVCVEQAVTMALGLPFSDNPSCVGQDVRRFKMRLNDCNWSSNEARAKGMRKLAVAQLGSDQIDQEQFRNELARLMIMRIVPIALRVAAKVNPNHAESLEAAAVRCEQEPTREVALEAKKIADAAAYAAGAYAAYAADADAAAAAAAYAAAAYAATAGVAERDRILTISAECGLEALKLCGSPGCQYLDLCEVE